MIFRRVNVRQSCKRRKTKEIAVTNKSYIEKENTLIIPGGQGIGAALPLGQ